MPDLGSRCSSSECSEFQLVVSWSSCEMTPDINSTSTNALQNSLDGRWGMGQGLACLLGEGSATVGLRQTWLRTVVLPECRVGFGISQLDSWSWCWASSIGGSVFTLKEKWREMVPFSSFVPGESSLFLSLSLNTVSQG